jgi:hypothetical protein
VAGAMLPEWSMPPFSKPFHDPISSRCAECATSRSTVDVIEASRDGRRASTALEATARPQRNGLSRSQDVVRENARVDASNQWAQPPCGTTTPAATARSSHTELNSPLVSSRSLAKSTETAIRRWIEAVVAVGARNTASVVVASAVVEVCDAAICCDVASLISEIGNAFASRSSQHAEAHRITLERR